MAFAIALRNRLTSLVDFLILAILNTPILSQK
nr:MAG TPA: hypothetical protein [Bacteriophage sp.]